MKSTNNMGKDNFERAWRDVFEGVKLTPSDQSWTVIEASIANEEVARYRRRVAYYQWWAAAGILLFIGLLGYLSYESLTTKNSLAKVPINQKKDTNIWYLTDSTSFQSGKKDFAYTYGKEYQTPRLLADRPTTPGDREESLLSQQETTRSFLTVIQRKQSKGLEVNAEEILPPLPERVIGVPIYRIKQDPERKLLWAGLNMAPGYFNPNYQFQQSNVQGLRSPSFAQGALQPEEDHRTGFSMSFGFEMGIRVSKRWHLSSGIQYINNNVQSSTNAILDQRTPIFSSVIESLDLKDPGAMVTFVPTELDNTFQFLSIPVQAGFLVFDKRIKILVNAGVSSDIFLKNKISAVDQSLESITINPGSNSPFKSVYFNGLIGAEANYEFLPRYLITLEPRYKLAINDFTRPETNYTSLPSSFSIGVGVKYIFK
jgi:hypothetical protein